MNDTHQTSEEVGFKNNMPLQASPPLNGNDSNLFPTDDEVADESFHLHLSEDEDDGKTEKKQEETKATTISSVAPAETEDKFGTTESTVLENIDDKLEDKLLYDAEDDGEANVPTDTPATDAGQQEDEGKTTSSNSDKDSKDNSSANDKKSSVGSAAEHEVDRKNTDSDKKKCADSAVTNKQESSVDSVKWETVCDVAENSVNAEDNAKEEKTNAEILIDHIMDIENLLQIVFEKDTEKNNYKDSCGGNSPRSVDKGESEDTGIECSDTETEKVEQDDDESETNRGAAKEDDGVDIEEDISFIGVFDIELEKEYVKMAKGRDYAEDKSGEDQETSDEEKSSEAADTAATATRDNIAGKEENTSVNETSVDMETAPCDEDSGKENDVISMTSDAATSGVIGKSLSAEKEATAVAEQAESTRKEVEDASDAVITGTSTKSSKRLLSRTGTASDAKKIKLQESDSAAVSKSMTVEVKDKKSEEITRDYNGVTPAPQIVVLNAVSEYMQSKNLKKLSLNDLEQICLMKMCEAICHKSEIAELRHQLGVQKQMVEMWSKEATTKLTKLAHDLEIANRKLRREVTLQNERDEPLIPVQVHYIPDKSPSSLSTKALLNAAAQSAAASPTTTATAAASTPSHMSTATASTPTASSTSTTPVLTSAPIANKSITNSSTKSKPKPAVNSKTFIDLTDEDDKKPATADTPTPTTLTTSTAQGFQIVSVPIEAENLVTTTGVVNPPGITYEYNNQLHHGVPAADATKPEAQQLMVKLNSNVIDQAANGTGQVQPIKRSSPRTTVSNTTTTAKTVLKHPVLLPLSPASQLSMPACKPIPPKPHLSIKRTSKGIVVSWKMPYDLDNYEAIASYQLYVYQQTISPPSSDMWRQVGEVKALALPMACILKHFNECNYIYHFAVRAVDVQKRIGPFSDPEQILL